MKRLFSPLLLAAALALSAGSAPAGVNDLVLAFSTPGVDRYADGSPVLDGECYALVWSPAGQAFAGFHADGTAASPADRVVLAAPLALDGRCRDCLFQVPADEAAALKGGTWSVCLVDTRTAAGVPAGAENGVPKRVNRWAVVEGGVKVADASALVGGSTGKPAARGMGGGVRATTLSEVPASTPAPVITAMEVADGVAAFAVADTVSYLTYTVESSETLGFFSTDAPSDCRFFRITRAE